MRFTTLLCVSVAALTALPAQAQSTSDKGHGDHDAPSEIIVTGIIARNRADVLSGTSIVSGATLERELRPTIGETFSRQAGVSATSFGPNASRPVLRGFQGERVRVLSDGIGSFDVSNTSVDHAVIINPLTADRIEVLRGPAALLYGSSAIGGVVNVIDSRIPRKVPPEKIHFDGTATYGSATNERSVASRVDVGLSDKIVFHFDGSFTKTDDLQTGSFILAPALRATAAASGDATVTRLAVLRGTLPNTAALTREAAVGAAIITGTGNLGFSISKYKSLYGVPIRFSVDSGVTAEAVRIDADQTRVDLRGEVNPTSGFIEAIRLRAGFADYKQDELQDTGDISTTFKNQGWEGRLELVQREQSGWRGAIGAQFFLRNLNIIGAERFLPKSETQQYGLFTVQSFDLGLIRAEASGRVEQSILSAVADAGLGNGDITRRFTAISGSIGASIEFISGWRLGLSGSYTQRSPAAEELFANGPHAGTQAFEIGNPNFAKEISKGFEATLRGKGDGYTVSGSLYYSDFDNFIFEDPTGVTRENLPVFQFRQAGARHYGFEVEASAGVAQVGAFAINVDGVGDYTRAKLKSGASLPRIPALRLLGGVEAQSDTLTGRVEVEWVASQNQLAAFETSTPSYTVTNMSINWKPTGRDGPVSLSLSANNLFDIEARRHASFLKDFAPLSGRDIRISARVAL
jgi:iron complex outermembrane recepter protein